MTYTNFILFLLGLLGILLHNLIKINKSRKKGAPISLLSYLKAEWLSVVISVIIVVIAVIVKHEIGELEAAGKWLGLSFVTIGYMGQSILVAWMGKVDKVIGDKNA